jgi:hypothetical protein
MAVLHPNFHIFETLLDNMLGKGRLDRIMPFFTPLTQCILSGPRNCLNWLLCYRLMLETKKNVLNLREHFSVASFVDNLF